MRFESATAPATVFEDESLHIHSIDLGEGKDEDDS